MLLFTAFFPNMGALNSLSPPVGLTTALKGNCKSVSCQGIMTIAFLITLFRANSDCRSQPWLIR